MHLVLSQAGVWQLLLLHVSIRFSAAIRSSVASFAAVLVLLPLDLFRLSTTGLHFRDLLYASEIHVVAILLALPLLQASYFLLRVLAAFSSRLPGAGGFLAGVSLFLMIQPAAGAASLLLLPELHWSIASLASLIVGLLIAFPLMALIPDLRGENAPLLTISSILAWLLSEHPQSSMWLAAVDLRDRVVLVVAFYLWLQIRRRLHRSPVYAPFTVSRKSQMIVGLLCLAFAAAAILDSHVALWSSALFLLLSWMFTARFLPGETGGKTTSRASQILLLAYLAGVAAVLHLAQLPDDAPAVSSRLLRSNSASGRMLLNTAVLLDGDYDGNSRWPGQDPDDRDPCLRRDGLNRCRRTARFIPEPAEPRILLVTRLLDSQAHRVTAEGGLYLASNRMEEVLMSIVRARDGYSVFTSSAGESAFAQMTESGYRTICVFVSVSERYAASLTHGCQVFLEFSDEESAWKAVQQYEERMTFAWIHSEVPAGSLALDELKDYSVHNVWLDVRSQSGQYMARGKHAPALSSEVLAAILGQEFAPRSEVVDVRHMTIEPPAAIRVLGIDPRRFVQSVRYAPRPGVEILERRTIEAYTGALETSGLWDIP
jgi:hypothetical protein